MTTEVVPIIITTMVVNNIEELLKLGLSEYEAKAYITLLGIAPATAYEIAKEAGLPTSKIYEVLKKLVTRDMVMETDEGSSSVLYCAQDPVVFLNLESARHQETVMALRSSLSTLKKKQSPSLIWNISSYDSLIERAKLLLTGAQREVLISLWPDEWKKLEPAIVKAQKKKLKVAVIFFAAESPEHQRFFTHPIEDTLYEEKGGRGFTAVADGNTAVMATIGKSEAVTGGYSANHGFVTLAEDYIKHDIYIMKIVSRFERELIKTFGPGYRQLRDIWTDKEEK